MLKVLGGSSGDSEQVTTNTGNIEQNQENIAINSINRLIDNGFALQNMSGAVADAYEDQSGINTGGSTFVYNATSDSYSNIDTEATVHIKSEEANGSTTFTDSGENAFTVTAVGDIQHSTTQAKFGTSSIRVDGTTDGLYIADDAALAIGSNDFKITMWYRPDDATPSGNRYLATHGSASGGGQVSWLLQHPTASATIRFYYSTDGGLGSSIQSSAVLSDNTWHYIEVSRSGTDLRLFIDGVQEAIDTSGGDTLHDSTYSLCIGADDTAGGFCITGYFEDFVLVNGAAGNTAGYTVPTSEFVPAGVNRNLLSDTFTADEEPTTAKIISLVEVGTGTLNTDLIGRISRDGGTTLDDVVLEDKGFYLGSIKIIASEPVTLTSTGTSVAYELETYNLKGFIVHASWVQWG